MAPSQSRDEQWMLCPKCRIANLATSVYCSSCGAVLDPGAPTPEYPSGASPKQWMLIIGIAGFLIGTALWAAFSPSSIAAKMYVGFLPFAYGIAVLYGFVRSYLCFRNKNFSGGILQCAFTILFALAALPEVFDLSR